MAASLPLDRFTPCAPRPMEEHARRRANTSISPKDMLQQLSASVSLQEDRFLALMRNLDIDFQTQDILDCIDETSILSDEIPHRSSRPTSPKHFDQQRKISIIPDPLTQPRSGRLSPTVLQMVLSPNISFFSEASSGADTSYDSGLYRWLGVRESSALEPPPFPPGLGFSKNPSDATNFNPDVSTLSSRSAYSQPSPSSSSRGVIFPLSPPPTSRLPFTESLYSDETEVENTFPQNPDILTRRYGQIFNASPSEIIDGEYSIGTHDSAAPWIWRNISLQHYVPSATVLRHFQRVIDELRGKYTPNDQGNNTPRPEWENSTSSRDTQARLSLLPHSRDLFSSLSSDYEIPQIVKVPPKVIESLPTLRRHESRSTRELHTEMAGILFQQAAQEEVQAHNLRSLAERLEILARQKRETALIIGKKGRGRPGNLKL